METLKATFFLVRAAILADDVPKLLGLTFMQLEALNDGCEGLVQQYREAYSQALSPGQNRSRHVMELTAKIEDDLRALVQGILTDEQRRQYALCEIIHSRRMRVHFPDD